ncbi:uncharacterized protein LAJ45_07000 [Morchella importuna]|nr:uncharacterized protein LAJ45_07000 [Morchella importuna]KAH8149024.1 hypothetical protein LAJ45_07000 [Morchella importuna]
MSKSTSPQEALGSVNNAPATAPASGGGFWCSFMRCLGFNKRYNLILWIFFGAVMLGFATARLGFLDLGPNGMFCRQAGPGECFWLGDKLYKIGMYLHLACILPCSIIAVFQFLPKIRHQALIVHRINGYLVLLLLIGGVTGALIITRHAFGGEVSTQVVSGTVSVVTLVSAFLAYYNIKRLQIDQHRKWMLRTMFYMGSIITTRLFMGISLPIIGGSQKYDTVWDCDQLMWTAKAEDVAAFYPECLGNETMRVVVPASFDRAETVGSILRLSFGVGFWLAFVVHAFGVEIYIRLTAGESERLRRVSYEKQVEAGISPAGSAGTTSDRFGDGRKWTPLATADGDF